MISAETIALVKERTDLVALVRENLDLKRRGRSYVGLCPFHKEKTPSFHVSQERGFFHCFGCKESGTAVDYLMKLEGLSFAEAVRALAERLGVPVEETASAAEQREASRRRQAREDLYALNGLAAAFFEQCLRAPRSPLARYAREELEARGLALGRADPALQGALAAFRVGYAPYGWDGLVSHLRQQEASLGAAERLGLIVPRKGGSGHYDRFRHRLMFAVLDVQGRVVAFSGRALREPEPAELAAAGLGPGRDREAGEAPAKYINSPESEIYVKGATVFGLHQARRAIRERGEAVLVEGNFDVLGLHARGIGHAVAPLGTAFTPAQAKLLRRYAPAVVLLFDGDAAGRKAVRAARAPAREAGLVAKVAVLPAGSDPDELARARGAEAIEALLGRARGLLEHLIDETLNPEALGAAELQEKQQRLREVAELLASENDPNIRAMAKTYADRLSSRVIADGRAPADLRELERLVAGALGSAQGPAAQAVAGRRDRSPPRTEHIGEAVFGAVLDFPELLGDPEVEEALSALEGDLVLGVAAVRNMWDTKKTISPDELLDLTPQAIHAFAVGRLASPELGSASVAKAELLENARKLRALSWLREKPVLLQRLAQARALGDGAAEDELLRELTRRSKMKLGLT